jgi:hypothetical protein
MTGDDDRQRALRGRRPDGPVQEGVGVKESQEPKQQPVCPVCRRQFEPGEGRYRVGFTSIHVDCYEKFKKTAPRLSALLLRVTRRVPNSRPGGTPAQTPNKQNSWGEAAGGPSRKALRGRRPLHRRGR